MWNVSKVEEVGGVRTDWGVLKLYEMGRGFGRRRGGGDGMTGEVRWLGGGKDTMGGSG